MAMLFLDNILRQAKWDIANFESEEQSHSSKQSGYHPYECPEKLPDREDIRQASFEEHWELWQRDARASLLTTHCDQLGVSSPINGNYCVNAQIYSGLLVGSRDCKCVPVTRD